MAQPEARNRSNEAISGSHPRSKSTTEEWSNRTMEEAAETGNRSTNEAPRQSPDSAAESSKEAKMRRAEELVDRIGTRVGEPTAFLGHQLLRFGARIREEAEDIWAEAQNVHRGQRP
jgi:hypothetical protein